MKSATVQIIEIFPSLGGDTGVRMPVVRAVTGLSTSSVWRAVKAGRLESFKTGPRVTVFRVSSIRQMLGGCDA